MTVTLDGDVIALSGPCGVEEVETLVNYLENHPSAPVHVGEATSIHTALWQALLVFRPKISGSPSSMALGQVLLGIEAYLRNDKEDA